MPAEITIVMERDGCQRATSCFVDVARRLAWALTDGDTKSRLNDAIDESGTVVLTADDMWLAVAAINVRGLDAGAELLRLRGEFLDTLPHENIHPT